MTTTKILILLLDTSIVKEGMKLFYYGILLKLKDMTNKRRPLEKAFWKENKIKRARYFI